MIDVRISGGLGNQLFQLGIASVLLHKNADQRILLRTGALAKYAVPRVFSLPSILDIEDNPKFTVTDENCVIHRLRVGKLLGYPIFSRRLVSDRNVNRILERSADAYRVYVDGYFGEHISQVLFDEVLCRVVELFRQRALEHIVSGPGPLCSIHIRGGDFIALGWSMKGEEAFYRSAIATIQSDNTSVRFRIVTDDPTKARQLSANLGVSAEIAESCPIDDFYRLFNSDYIIFSNSTFSFWAAAIAGAIKGTRSVGPDSWRPGVQRKIMLKHEISAYRKGSL